MIMIQYDNIAFLLEQQKILENYYNCNKIKFFFQRSKIQYTHKKVNFLFQQQIKD